MSDAWSPEQYHRFRDQRSAPFQDLLALIQPIPSGRAVDLGCGSGELTALMADRTCASDVVGIDSSTAMLAEAAAHERPGLHFTDGDLAAWDGGHGPVGAADGPVDLVVANASLQWVPDHAGVLRRWTDALAPAGQLAVQVPTNADHAAHRVAAAVASEEPFRSMFDGPPPSDPVEANVLRPEQYAELLHRLGYAEQHVRLQVYGMTLGSSDDVVEWVKGTMLTRFQRALPAEAYDAFVDVYRDRLRAALDDQRPYFYAFKRILFWGRR
jgi:trans-aconitate 2-methyltransferase